MNLLLKTLTLGFVVFLFLSISSLYQSCKPQRYCHLLKQITMTPFQNGGDTLQSADSVLATDFGVLIHVEDENFSCQLRRPNFGISSATATSIYVEDVFYDTIKKIVITSNQPFDATHPAGTSLNDLFQIPESFTSYVEFANQFEYRLQTIPDSSRFHQFHIHVDVSKTSPFDTILPPIYIRK